MPTAHDPCHSEAREGFRSHAAEFADGRLRLMVRSPIDQTWIERALAAPPMASGRQHATADLPGGGRVFVKTYMPRAGHSLWRRLRASRAIAEGRGYMAFGAAGIETPELLAWGEVRRRGLWMRGIVVTRLIGGPTVAEEFAARGDVAVVEQAAECLARIHRAGLVHGDPRLRNFLVSSGRIVPFDLCSWGRLTEARRREDLVKYLGSARTVVQDGVARRLLAVYSDRMEWSCPDEDRLMQDAEAYAKKERVP